MHRMFILTYWPGSFSSIYKFLLNALPILLPTSKRPRPSPFVLPNTGTSTPFPLESALDEEDPLGDTESTGTPLATRRGRLSLSAQAHQVWIRKKTRRWQSVLAGSVAGGIAIMLEKKNNRLGVAQQMFVRCVKIAFLVSFLLTSSLLIAGFRDRTMRLARNMASVCPTGMFWSSPFGMCPATR